MTATNKAAGAAARFSAWIAALQLDHRIRAARKRERGGLQEAGAVLCGSGSPAANEPAIQALRKTIDDIEVTNSELRSAMDASLAKDRQDWARATQLMRWVVVHRGLLDRWILRDRMKYHGRESDRLKGELGVMALDGNHAALEAAVPQAVRDGVGKARADIAAAQAARAQRLAPWNGQPLPGWMAVAIRETRAFVLHVWEQLSRRLFLRVPAIGALVASWWIAHHYAGGTLERIQHSMGLGGRAHLSPETLGILKFWVPLFVAALCTYIASAIAVRVQRKYAPPEQNVARASSP